MMKGSVSQDGGRRFNPFQAGVFSKPHIKMHAPDTERRKTSQNLMES